MRGMVSICPWSPISISKRFILARPTSWWAISRPRWKNHRAHFVAFAEEPQDLVLANLIVVLRSGGPELDFLQLRAAAALALLVGFLVGLIKIFAVVGDLANRRISRGRDFHQIEPFFLG